MNTRHSKQSKIDKKIHLSQSFYPPSRTLMGPGPSNVNPRVLAALSRPTIGHLDPEFIILMDSIKELLQYVFQTQNQLTLPISAPGSAGMEACFVNLLETGDSVIVCQNGVFGGRMKENVERCGATPIMIHDPWGEAINLEKVESVLKKNPKAKALAFVHAETSTGVLSDAHSLCQLAHQFDCLSIVDCVTSVAGVAVNIDAWQADAVYSGTQKCLSCVPGLSPVSFSEKAVHAIQSRSHKIQSWFLDMDLIMGYWGQTSQRAYHHTAPVNALYALHESLVILQEEGLENAWRRHQRNHEALVAGIEAMGLSMAVNSDCRLPQLNSVTVPKGIDEQAVRQQMLAHYDLEIGAGLGDLAGKVWRIGLMGYASQEKNVLLCLNALDNILTSMSADIDSGTAVAAAQAVWKN